MKRIRLGQHLGTDMESRRQEDKLKFEELQNTGSIRFTTPLAERLKLNNVAFGFWLSWHLEITLTFFSCHHFFYLICGYSW